MSMRTDIPWRLSLTQCTIFHDFSLIKAEKILKGSLDLIPSPSPSMKIQIIFGKVFLITVGKTGTKKKFWILDFIGFCCPSEFSGL